MTKILIIHTNGMGDFLMFTPAYKELINQFPNSEIDFFITNKNNEEIIKLYPNIKKIYIGSLKKIDLLKSIKELRKKRYDYCIITTGGKTWKSNLFLFFIKAKIKVGEYKYIKNIFCTKQIKRREDSHFVENNLRIVRSICNFPLKSLYKLWMPLSDINQKKKSTKKIICIHPGCQKLYKERRWDKFSELIRELLKFREKIEIIVFLGKEDIEIAEEFYKIEGIEIIQEKSLMEVIKILQITDIFINSDSGLGHLYTCFNSKIISIFGPNQLGLNQELRTGPYSADANIIKIRGVDEKYYKQKNKYTNKLKCLEDITVEMVLVEINKMLWKD
ncbi:ADP-heptose:LPS heptosyltransferase [Cetobacterium ceti]|uniref:ADP-heptose:LPS heptosyltransferase n=1 Tax=Cetobacterium ceti TaxID=180163 RepID=A0A1T4LSS4_9FUSO|nr:glycosyltransferase family 9 protein [Cetobacterium ceti]SJZ57735.1 ADP-heptose:LPS heptosyltransferase [Cetobacterium ceti]